MKQGLGIRSNVEITSLIHKLKIKQEKDGRCSMFGQSLVFVSEKRESSKHQSRQEHNS